ncbi:MAG TPA: VWA domain-containing protein [Candidatus Acidoferrales bacterium]|nr:VWA domain-containing protein [Candidatus Acidoferrales bacterium]
MQRKWIAAFAVTGIMAAVALHGQAISDDEIQMGSHPYVPLSASIIRVRSAFVQVPVIVRDKQGKAVGGLKKFDFELFDNGHQVEISSFSVENTAAMPLQDGATPQTLTGPQPSTTPTLAPSPTPRNIALFFDDASMRTSDAGTSRNAAEVFVRTTMKPGDKIGIFTTSATVSLSFTDNVPKILETLAQLRPHIKRLENGTVNCSAMTPHQAHLILDTIGMQTDALALGNALCGQVDPIPAARQVVQIAEQASEDSLGAITDVIHYLGGMPGRRILLLASSGFLTETLQALQAKQDKVIDEAVRANVIINSLDAKGLVAAPPGVDDDGHPVSLGGRAELRGRMLLLFIDYQNLNREALDDPLAMLAEGTGGRFFHNRNDLDAGLRDMLTTPDVSYVLTFSPGDLKTIGETHSLKVKLVNSSGLNIQARRGYLVPDTSPTDAEKKQRKLDNAVLATDNPESIPMQVTTYPGTLDTGGHVLSVAVHFDANKLAFQTQGDRKVDRLIFVTALFDTQDHYLSGVQGVMDLRLKKETMGTILSQGLDASLTLEVAPGTYRLREVVEDIEGGQISAISRPVEIH